jgi:hypothetical protein
MFKIFDKYEWPMFWYWLGDESNFAGTYRDAFQEVLPTLSQEQTGLIENKGRNLENIIHKWRSSNTTITLTCLQFKIYDFITYQFKKNDLKSIIGVPC